MSQIGKCGWGQRGGRDVVHSLTKEELVEKRKKTKAETLGVFPSGTTVAKGRTHQLTRNQTCSIRQGENKKEAGTRTEGANSC